MERRAEQNEWVKMLWGRRQWECEGVCEGDRIGRERWEWEGIFVHTQRRDYSTSALILAHKVVSIRDHHTPYIYRLFRQVLWSIPCIIMLCDKHNKSALIESCVPCFAHPFEFRGLLLFKYVHVIIGHSLLSNHNLLERKKKKKKMKKKKKKGKGCEERRGESLRKESAVWMGKRKW